MSWLVRDGDVLASVEIADEAAARRRGLLGRPEVDGALVLRPCRQVHTFAMRIPLDVVWCDATGRVIRIRTVAPWRLTRPVLGAAFVVEASAGAAARWGLCVGDRLELRA